MLGIIFSELRRPDMNASFHGAPLKHVLKMAAPHKSLDPHAKPPDVTRHVFKRHLRRDAPDTSNMVELEQHRDAMQQLGEIGSQILKSAFEEFCSDQEPSPCPKLAARPVFGHERVPGLPRSQNVLMHHRAFVAHQPDFLTCYSRSSNSPWPAAARAAAPASGSLATS
jgi:hypothetical protein